VEGFGIAHRPEDVRWWSTLCATIEAEDAYDLTDRLSGIKLPTLVVGGDRDAAYGAALFRETAEGLPNAKLLLYFRTGARRRAGASSIRSGCIAIPVMTQKVSRRQFCSAVVLTAAGVAGAGCRRGVGPAPSPSPSEASRDAALAFPEGFAWGVATSAYQIEGAVKGRRTRPFHLGHVLRSCRRHRRW
jgi:hypothetical protein